MIKQGAAGIETHLTQPVFPQEPLGSQLRPQQGHNHKGGIPLRLLGQPVLSGDNDEGVAQVCEPLNGIHWIKVCVLARSLPHVVHAVELCLSVPDEPLYVDGKVDSTIASGEDLCVTDSTQRKRGGVVRSR